MPARPASLAQLRLIHFKANKGEKWAQKTVKEYHGKHFGKLPAHARVRRLNKKS